VWKEPDIVTRLQKASRKENDLYSEAAQEILKWRRRHVVNKCIMDIVANQEPLPEECELILRENLQELYDE
jgi:hypothetical protein